jgi:sporulation protein YlmC with PRC-barrel domain
MCPFWAQTNVDGGEARRPWTPPLELRFPRAVSFRDARKETNMTSMQTDLGRGEVPREETASLIASDKVEGTAVYGLDGDKIGRVENLMIDKWTGKVAYAVLSFGGFLGMAHDHYPLPWSMLKYDEKLGGYRVNITREQLQNAPRYRDEDRWDWTSPEYPRQVDEHYRPFAFI